MKTNWQIKKLNEVCEVEYGTRVVNKRDGGTKYPVYGGGGATFFMDEYNREDKMVIARFAMSESCTRFVKGKFFLNDSGLTVVPKNNKEVDQDFLDLQLIFLNDHIYSLARGAAQKNLDVPAFKNMSISYPESLTEQKRIVKILDESFKKIEKVKENAEKNLQNSKELFESYLNNIFTSKKKDWKSNKLDEVCEMINRGVSPKYIESKGLCVLNQKCVRDHKINFSLSRLHDFRNKKVSNEKYLQIGDVLVNSTGTGTLGRVAQVKELPIEAITDSHITIVRPMKNIFYSDFFGYGLIFVEKEISKRGDGCGGQTELARNTLKNDFSINYPISISVQKDIVKKINIISEQTKKFEVIYKKKLTDLEELKKSVLKKAFSGEL